MMMNSPLHRLPMLLDALDRADVEVTADDDGLHLPPMDADQRAEVIAELGEMAGEIDGLLDAVCAGDDYDYEGDDDPFDWSERLGLVEDNLAAYSLDTF